MIYVVYFTINQNYRGQKLLITILVNPFYIFTARCTFCKPIFYNLKRVWKTQNAFFFLIKNKNYYLSFSSPMRKKFSLLNFYFSRSSTYFHHSLFIVCRKVSDCVKILFYEKFKRRKSQYLFSQQVSARQVTRCVSIAKRSTLILSYPDHSDISLKENHIGNLLLWNVSSGLNLLDNCICI